MENPENVNFEIMASSMSEFAKRDKPFELDRFEFGFIVAVWRQWREHNLDRLQEPVVQRLDERITKHFEDAYRSEVF